MEISEQDLAGAQLRPFAGLGLLLHLHDHLRGREDLGRRVGNARAGSAVDVVARPDPGAGTGFDHDLVAGMDVFTNRAGREPDAGTHAF
jgi:hypothetical protein